MLNVLYGLIKDLEGDINGRYQPPAQN